MNARICRLALLSAAMGLLLPVALASAAFGQTPAGLITDPGFEAAAGGGAAGWRPFERGYAMDHAIRHTGAQAIRCTNATTGEARGASWTVTLDQKEPAPLLVSGWSRAENVGGASDSGYSLYVDLVYTDGTPLWGQIAKFETGTHDWERRQVVIVPAKPVRSATINALFRGHAGTVWFDDITASELKGDRFFDSQPITAPRLPAGAASGWFARDVAADSPILPLSSGKADSRLGLLLRASKRGGRAGQAPAAGGAERDATITDTSGRPRAITVYYVERFTGAATWWNDIRHSVAIGKTGERSNLTGMDCGATGAVSLYPFGCVTAAHRGRALGVPPLLGPRVFRIAYNASAGLLYVAFDVALVPENRAGRDVERPGGRASARLAVVSYDVDPAWGFRSAADRFYRLFPEAFDRRAKAEGIWIPFTDPSKVERVGDFGIAYHEGDNSVPSDDRLGILSFRYTEPMTWWMAMPKATPRTYDAALAMATRLAAPRSPAETGGQEPSDPSLRPWAQALLHSGSRDARGRFNVEFRDTPWADGALWILNPDPRLPHSPSAPTKASISYTPEMADRLYGAGAKGVLDGEYLDSIEGWADCQDYRPESIAWSEAPPTFATESNRPVVMTWASVWEFAAYLRADLRRRGKLLMANSTPWRIHQFAPLLDVMGTETNWLPGGVWRPDSDEVFNLRRTLCYHKPYLLLQNTDFDRFGMDRVEKYFQRSMFYGCYPSMFSVDASSHPYWQEPRWYNRDRPLFLRYIPAIRKLSSAGWEPITYARSDNPSVYVERFGPRSFTVLNSTQAPTVAQVTLDLPRLGLRAPRQAVDLVSGERTAMAGGVLRVPLGPGAARAFRVE